jgi:leader peptidase (prepilin peptidase)/N-methyltransferase
MTTAAGAVLAGLFGAIIGSFLNVVAYRLPRGESLSHPPSRCPSCGAPVKPYDNIPVLSWLLLRGRCRNCKEPISWRYPLVEAATGILCALVVVAKGADQDAILGIVLVLLLVPITLIDFDTQIIPNKITYPGVVVGIAIVALTDLDSLPENLIAAFAAGGFFFIAWFLKPGGMGLGDVVGLFAGDAIVDWYLDSFT